MLNINEKYIVNDKGEKTAVIIELKDYEKIVSLLEYLDEFDCLDVNFNIAKGLKDLEEGRIYDIDNLFEGTSYEI
jgi:PHD/YefM family antitoxin component YafN of YafNO toxin-antitoxin module